MQRGCYVSLSEVDGRKEKCREGACLPAIASRTGVSATSRGVRKFKQGMLTSPIPSIRTNATLSGSGVPPSIPHATLSCSKPNSPRNVAILKLNNGNKKERFFRGLIRRTWRNNYLLKWRIRHIYVCELRSCVQSFPPSSTTHPLVREPSQVAS